MGYLVLSRERWENVDVGYDIKVCNMRIRGDKVSLGLRAPSNYLFHRAEVLREARQEGWENESEYLEKMARKAFLSKGGYLILSRDMKHSRILVSDISGAHLGEICLSSVRGDRASIAFDFPRSVPIVRDNVKKRR